MGREGWFVQPGLPTGASPSPGWDLQHLLASWRGGEGQSGGRGLWTGNSHPPIQAQTLFVVISTLPSELFPLPDFPFISTENGHFSASAVPGHMCEGGEEGVPNCFDGG